MDLKRHQRRPGKGFTIRMRKRGWTPRNSYASAFCPVSQRSDSFFTEPIGCLAYRDQEDVLEYAFGEAHKGRRLAVCCWGDLNVSARELLARVSKRASHVELVPGISSVQIACARSGISLEDTIFITLHQRREVNIDLEELVHYLREGRRHIILLPRPWDLMPPAIAAHLLEAGIPKDVPVRVFQRLTLPEEQDWTGTLKECADFGGEHSDLTIMVFPRPTGGAGQNPRE